MVVPPPNSLKIAGDLSALAGIAKPAASSPPDTLPRWRFVQRPVIQAIRVNPIDKVLRQDRRSATNILNEIALSPSPSNGDQSIMTVGIDDNARDFTRRLMRFGTQQQ